MTKQKKPNIYAQTVPFTVNDGLRLGRLLLLLPQGLGGFKLVHLGATQGHSWASTLAAWRQRQQTVLVRGAGGGGFVGVGWGGTEN